MWWSKNITEEQQQVFQEQISWKHPERSVLKSWVIETRDYDTKPANWIYIIANILIVIFLTWLFCFFAKHVPLWSMRIGTLIGLSIFFLLFHWMIYSVTFNKKLLVYRLTKEGFEVAGWNSQAASQKKIFIGVAIVCSIIALIIVALVPQAFILLFIGPGGIVLMMVTMSGNSQAWENQRDYSQKDFDWDLFTEVLLFKQRHILTMVFDFDERNKRINKYSIMEKIHVFCYPEQYDDIINYIKDKVKAVPFKEGRVEIFPDECS